MGSVLPTSGTRGAKMSILLVEWGLWAGHTGSQNEGFVSPSSGAEWWGQREPKWGVPLMKWNLGSRSMGSDKMEYLPTEQDCWDPKQGGPCHSGTVGAWRRVREGTWAFFSIS